MPNKDHYIKLLKEDFPNISFSGLEELKERYCEELHDILIYEEIELKGKVFKGLEKIEVNYLEEARDDLALYKPDERILEINGQYYGEKANKEKDLYKDNNLIIISKRFDIVINHELWHYYVREYNINNIDNVEWNKMLEFYKDNDTYIRKFFTFLDAYLGKLVRYVTGPNEYGYYAQIKEEFIVETFAYLNARVLYDEIKLNDKDKLKKYIEKFKDIEEKIYTKCKETIIRNLSGGI